MADTEVKKQSLNDITQEALKELRLEEVKLAKEKIKTLVREKHAAEAQLRNVERKMQEAYAEIGEKLEGL